MNNCGKSHLHQPKAISALTAQLRRRSRRITAPRKAILQTLRKNPHPLTNRQILAALPRGKCDLATIYRAMHLLVELHIVDRFDFGDGIARFELVSKTGKGAHHHHLVCTQCEEVIELQECFSHYLEKRIAAKNGFKGVTHKLEFFGICPACQ